MRKEHEVSETSQGIHATWGSDGAEGHAVFSIEGMRCAGCSRSVERAVRAIDGVKRISVNVATARAAVDWHPRKASFAEILAAIRRTGFKPVPLSGEAAALAQRDERRIGIKRLGVAGIGMMQTMMFMYGLYAAGSQGIDPPYDQYLRLVSMLVSTPVLVYSGAPFFRGAWRDLRSRALGMDVPVALALALAYGASVINTLRGSGEVYFDSVTMFIFFLLAGRFVEMTVRHRSLSSTEALARSLPATAARWCADGRIERVPVEALAAGDRLSIAKGAVIPVDCALEDGVTSVDEALITGESAAVVKRAGEQLLGGSVNLGEPVQAVVRSGVQDSALAVIVGLLDRAQAERPPVAREADRAASWFIAAVLALATLVAGAWLLIDPSRAFAAALAVLVVTCPCALSLATPTAIAAATARLARLGLLVTRPDALERLAQVDTVMLDKTGTLTHGSPIVRSVRTLNGYTDAYALAVAAALERASEHPLAGAFEPYGNAQVQATDLRELAGRGIEGRIGADTWRLGRPDYVAELGGDIDASADDDGLYLGKAGEVAAVFTLTDAVRGDAGRAVDDFRSMGLEVAIASGDRRTAVRRIAAALGIHDAAGRLSPREKLEALAARQRSGRRVLMIGDGINDGPVLAAAHVSCAMGQGSAVAQAAADLLLLNDSLRALAEGIRTSRRALVVVRQNLRWAFVYNVAAVPLAAVGWVPPWVAAIGMSLSSLLVVLNARRLARRPGSGRTTHPPAIQGAFA